MKEAICTVLIPEGIPDPDIERGVFGAAFTVVAPAAAKIEEIPMDLWRRADAVMGRRHFTYDAGLMKHLERCKLIIRMGVGFDNIDVTCAGELGIAVSNVPDYCTTDVADHAIGLMLGFSRGVLALSASVRESEWQWEQTRTLRRLSGSTLGIIGLGRIGTAVAMRAKGLEMKVLFYDPYLREGIDKSLGIGRCYAVKELLAGSDVVSMHVPLTNETRDMADEEFFRAMKPGSLFINTARGKIMDSRALCNALRSGHLSAAGLDVWPVEPPPENDPLIQSWRAGEPWIRDRFTLTPHAAFFCRDSWKELRTKAALEVKRVLQGEKPRACVNEEWLVNPRYRRI
jgi:phosphoglycerate dehydrogenase-like enzyme